MEHMRVADNAHRNATRGLSRSPQRLACGQQSYAGCLELRSIPMARLDRMGLSVSQVSELRVKTPEDATMFFVPIYGECYLWCVVATQPATDPLPIRWRTRVRLC